MNPTFSLRTRQENGGTAVLQEWGADCEYGVLRDVLLGPVEAAAQRSHPGSIVN